MSGEKLLCCVCSEEIRITKENKKSITWIGLLQIFARENYSIRKLIFKNEITT